MYTPNFNNFVFERLSPPTTTTTTTSRDVESTVNRFLFPRRSHGFIRPQFNKSTALSLMRRIPSEFDKRAAPRVLREGKFARPELNSAPDAAEFSFPTPPPAPHAPLVRISPSSRSPPSSQLQVRLSRLPTFHRRYARFHEFPAFQSD